jgi:hypothetical protein
MIKIKLDIDNFKCFSGLIHAKSILPDYSIELVTGGSYDYELVGTNEYMNTGMSFKDSIEYGCNALSKKTGDYFLVHGGDSTSLTAAYEVFKNSNSKYLFKKQLLTQEKYKESSIIGKWFFGTGSVLDKSYNLTNEEYSKLKLCGYNVGHNWPSLHKLYQPGNKDIDVAAIFQTKIPKEVFDHEVRTDTLYFQHRNNVWKELSKLNYNIVSGQFDSNTTAQTLNRSKIAISPYGMGELCYRDLEAIQHGCILIKPDMSDVITEPNLFIKNQTYIPCKVDYSDLNNIIEKVLGNYKEYSYIIENSRKQLVEVYSNNAVAMYWYNFFTNLDSITQN